MILGIGVDIVEIKRLRKWEKFSYDQLRRIFSKVELFDVSHPSILFSHPDGFQKSLGMNGWVCVGFDEDLAISVRPECCRQAVYRGMLDVSKGEYDSSSLAARFAAKEAFFKALSATLVKLGYTKKEFSLLFLCRHVSVVKSTWDVPVLKIDWTAIEEKIENNLQKLKVELSISHEKDYAVAFVVICRE